MVHISNELRKLFGPDMSEELDNARRVRIRTVRSPFILADNFFDIGESNNNSESYNVVVLRTVSFTGGAMFREYEKDGDNSYVVQGNLREGYNVFNLI